MEKLQVKLCSVAIVTFACLVLVTAQQPAAVDVITANATCNSTTSKPSPTTSSYIFNTCIVAKFAAYLSIGGGKYIELKNGIVNHNASQCHVANNTKINPKLVIDFGTCSQLEFEITKQANGSDIYVKAINGFYKNGDQKITFSNSSAMFHTTQPGHYYKCNTEQALVMQPPEIILMLSNFAYEAYRNASGTDFYQIAEQCALDSSQVSDLVRIGVGICLVALVVIVLIAYFVGRRRWSERSSYESV